MSSLPAVLAPDADTLSPTARRDKGFCYASIPAQKTICRGEDREVVQNSDYGTEFGAFCSAPTLGESVALEEWDMPRGCYSSSARHRPGQLVSNLFSVPPLSLIHISEPTRRTPIS